MRLIAAFVFSFITVFFTGCITSFNAEPAARLYIVQEIKMDDNNSLFWFRNEDELFHEGPGYFQFTNDKCNLSRKPASAFCSQASQIYKSNDTVFV